VCGHFSIPALTEKDTLFSADKAILADSVVADKLILGII
jgi:hypothetical protein